MTPSALRPLSAGEVLDLSFGLYRRLFLTLMGIQLVCMAIPFLLNLYVAGSGGGISTLAIVTMVVSFVLGALASAATATAISETYLDRPISAAAALARSAPRLVPLLTVSILIALLLAAACIPFVFLVGGAAVGVARGAGGNVGFVAIMMLVGLASLALPLIVMSGVAVSTPVVVLEDGIGAAAAIARTWFLTKGYRLRIAGLLFVCAVIIMIPYFGFAILGGLAGGGGGSLTRLTVSATVGAMIGRLLVTPVLYCLITLLYYDLRVRKEGFDLEMLAASLQPA